MSTSKNTNQRIIEQTTKFRDVIVNRATDGLLRQVTIEWDVLNGTSNVSSQTLKDPADQKPHVKRQEHQYRKEFHNGSGPYHEAKTIQHPDMADDLTAQEIAQRVFSRSAVQKMELTVTLTGPVSIPSVACMVTIPDTVVTVASGSNVVTRTISGGSYWLIETRESMHASGGEVQHRNAIEVEKCFVIAMAPFKLIGRQNFLIAKPLHQKRLSCLGPPSLCFRSAFLKVDTESRGYFKDAPQNISSMVRT